ncbi:hypothetical protein REPUB_Repub08aG0075000 [Reevesia pubescens]
MDQYYHHHQLNNQWRQPQPPQQPNICPVCSIPHFPFCPSYPPYHHQPPHYARPGFDPFQPPPPPTPPPPYANGFPDPRSWHPNPNYGYDYGTAAAGGEVDRSYKRARIDEFGSGPGPGPDQILTEDERRLKLVHDHGGASLSGFNQENKYFHNNINNNNNATPLPPRSSEMYNIEDSLNNYTDYSNKNNYNQQQQIQHKDSVPTVVNHWQGFEQRIGGYLQRPGGNNMAQPPPPPPLPASPPPPLPMEPPVQHHSSSEFKAYSSSPNSSFSLFPIHVSSSVTANFTYPVVPEPYHTNKLPSHASGGFHGEDPQVIHRNSSGQYVVIPPKQLSSDKPKIVDASELFKMPHRASRPYHIVIILRGLPGSGKSYLAKMLRDLEVENGGDAPRIHSMDDYFMTEVEKDEETDVSKSSSSARSKKTVMEYCYEPEMEEAYRESMLKAFKRTLEDGIFSFVIVDDRNLRVADFAQFWAIGKRSGYEVYVLEATYKDPVGCAARNVHGFTLDDIQQMAGQWEEAPSLYVQLDIKSLFHGDDLKRSGILEVDMDMEDGDREEGLSGQQEEKPEKMNLLAIGVYVPEALDSSKDEKRWDAEGDHPAEVKELRRSKWSNDLDEDETEGSEAIKGNLNALSGLIRAYGKKGKSVHWSDQSGDTGFSIGAAKKAKMLSLVIGPGAGYNLNSNPLPKEESHTFNSSGNSKKQSSFQEQLRAEHESFKAVFDRRKRIGGLDLDEDQ